MRWVEFVTEERMEDGYRGRLWFRWGGFTAPYSQFQDSLYAAVPLCYVLRASSKLSGWHAHYVSHLRWKQQMEYEKRLREVS